MNSIPLPLYILRPLLVVSAKVKSSFACLKSVAAYSGSVGLKTIEDAAIAAAVSATTVEPGLVKSTLKDGLGICITSAGPHHEWSNAPSPT